jgi:hypothetical protein
MNLYKPQHGDCTKCVNAVEMKAFLKFLAIGCFFFFGVGLL